MHRMLHKHAPKYLHSLLNFQEERESVKFTHASRPLENSRRFTSVLLWARHAQRLRGRGTPVLGSAMEWSVKIARVAGSTFSTETSAWDDLCSGPFRRDTNQHPDGRKVFEEIHREWRRSIKVLRVMASTRLQENTPSINFPSLRRSLRRHSLGN